MTTVITMGNFKGGAGKTTNSVMAAYALAKQGRKVLVLDMDPQANATRIFLKTEEVNNEQLKPIKGYFLDALQTQSLNDFVRVVSDNLSDNLKYLPNSPTFKDFDQLLEEVVPGKKAKVYEQRLKYFASIIDTIKYDYDYIFIDVPPTNSIFTDAALYASDFALFSLQTQTLSLDGATSMLDYLKTFVRQYGVNLEVLGVLCVILKPNSQIDNKVVRQATTYFDEDNMFMTQIKYMERLKRYADEGIIIADHHDKNVMAVYEQLANEIETRLAEFGVMI